MDEQKTRFDWIVILGNIVSVLSFFSIAFLLFFGAAAAPQSARPIPLWFDAYQHILALIPISLVASWGFLYLRLFWIARLISFSPIIALFTFNDINPLQFIRMFSVITYNVVGTLFD